MSPKFIVPVLLLSACAGTVSAAEAARSVETLVAEALLKNPELKFYEAEMSAARAGAKSAALRPPPELGAELGRKTVASDEGVAWSASVMIPFEWPGRIGLRKAIANRDLDLAQLGHDRFKAALATEVRDRSFDLFAAQEKAAAADEVAERFKALREVLVQRDPAGLTPLLETRVIEATELNARRAAGEASLAVKTALIELNQLRGAKPDAPLVVEKTRLTFRPTEQFAALAALAQTNHFDLRVRAKELERQGFRVALAQNERWPEISVGPSVSEERAGETERVIGLAVSLPLSMGKGRNEGNVSAAQARQSQAETLLLVARREVEKQVATAAAAYEAKLQTMADWRPDSVQHFQEAAVLADRHYRLGAVPIATYVELQQQYLEAVESLLDTKREALEAAVELERLTGRPFVETIADGVKK